MGVRVRWGVAAAIVATLVAAPAAARATLAFVRNPVHPIVWSAADDGSGQRIVAPGSSPHISPDGQWIAYLRVRGTRSYHPDLMLVPASGGAPPRWLMTGFQEPFWLAWSTDSSTIAAVRGPDLGPRRLVLIDVASGAQRVIARGYFGGFSFSPDGTQLVYAQARSYRFPLRSDLYRVDVAGGAPLRITYDHRSTEPLWSPATPLECVRAAPPCVPEEPRVEGIVFVKLLGEKQRRFGPKNELFLMNPDGGEVRRLTHTRVDPLTQGLMPRQWSADGSRLLAEFGGQDVAYPVTVNPATGAQRPLLKLARRGFRAADLSADGSTILGSTGGEPGPWCDVGSVPYGGGHVTILARHAFEPDWSR